MVKKIYRIEMIGGKNQFGEKIMLDFKYMEFKIEKVISCAIFFFFFGLVSVNLWCYFHSLKIIQFKESAIYRIKKKVLDNSHIKLSMK